MAFLFDSSPSTIAPIAIKCSHNAESIMYKHDTKWWFGNHSEYHSENRVVTRFSTRCSGLREIQETKDDKVTIVHSFSVICELVAARRSCIIENIAVARP